MQIIQAIAVSIRWTRK